MPISAIQRWYEACTIAVCDWLLAGCGRPGIEAEPAYAYVAHAGTLSTYSIDPTTGGLTAFVGYPLVFPTSWLGSVGQIATDPSGRFLYLLDYSGVHAYSINRDTGALKAVAGSPFEPGSLPIALAFHASGKYLYVAGYSSPIAPVNTVISAFSVKGSGALMPLARYTLPGPDLQSSDSTTVISAGNHLYVAGYHTHSITAFSIGSAGELHEDIPGSPFATGGGPYSIVADPSGSVLYTANAGAPTATGATPGSISAFRIDSRTGALTPIAVYPRPTAVRGAISIDPRGRFLLVPEMSAVAVYAIDATTGALSAVAGSPFSAGTAPSVVSVSPTDRFVYVVNEGSASVSEFSLESTGELTPLAGSPVPVRNNPSHMAGYRMAVTYSSA
jgi:6-phosphogluconolactonase